MRHGKKFNHLSRTSSHRKAMLSNMATSLIMHRRIKTTVPKAKELRKYVEPLITRAKNDTSHNRRTVFSYLKNKEVINELFNAVGRKVGDRPGGYTRIIKMGNRLGDNAEICYIELVDYNTLLADSSATKRKTRRSRRGKKGGGSQEQTADQQTSDAPSTEAVADVEAASAKPDDAEDQTAEQKTENTDSADTESKEKTT